MSDQMKAHNRRLQRQIERLEARNQQLRDELEHLSHGEQRPWTAFVQIKQAIAADGQILDVDNAERCVMFANSRYQVSIWKHPLPADGMPEGAECFHLSIKRNDGSAVRDWRDMQRIKNELLGDEAEAVELYPAESRLVDGANQYHLWALVGCQWPIGFRSRLVSENQSGGVQQRPWEANQRPSDLVKISVEQMMAHLQGKQSC
jgi:hypothetical protein